MKEDIIKAIEERILSEQKKHPELEWAKIAAGKIYAMLQPKKMVSSEELWNKYKSDVQSGYGTYDLMTKENFFQAMQTYAQQTNAEELKRHAIGFAIWIGVEGWEYLVDEKWLRVYVEQKTTDELYTEYLKTLTTKQDESII